MFREYVKFIKENKIFFVATSVINKAEIYPFDAISCDDNFIYLAGDKRETVTDQILLNPNIQIISFNNVSNKYVRITARVIVEEKMDKKELLFNENPILYDKFDSIQNPNLVVFRLIVTKVERF